MTTKPKTKAAKAPESEMTLEEMRAALDGEEKVVFLRLSTNVWDTPSFLKNKTPEEIVAYLDNEAKAEPGFPSKYKLDHRSIPVTKVRREYDYGSRSYVSKKSTKSEGPHWVLVGYQPYTDEELLEKGPKLVAAKKKREAAAAKRLQKQVDDFNKKARALGQPEIRVEDVK